VKNFNELNVTYISSYVSTVEFCGAISTVALGTVVASACFVTVVKIRNTVARFSSLLMVAVTEKQRVVARLCSEQRKNAGNGLLGYVFLVHDALF
jgi:hypothetical protein